MRKTVVAGIPMGIASGRREEFLEQVGGDGSHLLICVRVSEDMMTRKDWPALWDRRRKCVCERCLHAIWFDPLSSPAPELSVRLCTYCAADHLRTLSDRGECAQPVVIDGQMTGPVKEVGG